MEIIEIPSILHALPAGYQFGGDPGSYLPRNDLLAASACTHTSGGSGAAMTHDTMARCRSTRGSGNFGPYSHLPMRYFIR